METSSPFEIESFALPALEAKIMELYDGYTNNSLEELSYLDCLKDCLGIRKDIINQNCKFTPETVKHIERINAILTENTAKVLTKAGVLNKQMKAQKLAGDDFLDEFIIETTMGVTYTNEESILTLNIDENNGESDYHAMAEILHATAGEFTILRRFFFSYMDNEISGENNDDSNRDESLRQNWNFGLIGAPELRHIPYFCYASHILFEESNYSISDIIRINDIRNEIKVTWKNLKKDQYISPDMA